MESEDSLAEPEEWDRGSAKPIPHLSAHKLGASRHRTRMARAGDTAYCPDTDQS